MKQILTVLLFVAACAVSAYSQKSLKPKLGKGTITGVIAPSEGVCAGYSYSNGSICVSSGKYLLQLGIRKKNRTIISGGTAAALTQGRRVRITYTDLSNSEQDTVYLFTGDVVQITILAGKSKR